MIAWWDRSPQRLRNSCETYFRRRTSAPRIRKPKVSQSLWTGPASLGPCLGFAGQRPGGEFAQGIARLLLCFRTSTPRLAVDRNSGSVCEAALASCPRRMTCKAPGFNFFRDGRSRLKTTNTLRLVNERQVLLGSIERYIEQEPQRRWRCAKETVIGRRGVNAMPKAV
jgi:hypothetical protein